jgi:hypothetical protein
LKTGRLPVSAALVALAALGSAVSAQTVWHPAEVVPLTLPEAAPREGTATLASSLLPGAGQYLLGQRRKWVYLALEVLGWAVYLDGRSDGNRFRDQYRDFAWNQARISSGSRRDADFAYYETLTKWDRSGAFDRDGVTQGVQPETDPATFNGSIWALAARIYVPGGANVIASDPQYQRALEYYSGRAYDSDFLWDWTGTGADQSSFGAMIQESDEGFRQATNAVGAVIANHVVSAIDAYLSARGVPTPSEARLVRTQRAVGARWTAELRISLPR